MAGSIAAALTAASVAQGAPLFWDGGTVDLTGTPDGLSQGGAGTWNTTTLNWDNGTAYQAWVNGNLADFGGIGGTVTLGSAISASGIVFDGTGTNGYNLLTNSTGGLTLTLSSAAGITANNASGTNTISGTGSLLVTAPQTWTQAGGGTLAIGTPVSLTANGLTLAGAGSFSFTGAISSTVPAGSVAITIGTGAGSGTQASFTGAGSTIAGDIAINGGLLNYSGGTQTTANQLGVGSGSVFRQIFLTNGGTFQVSNADFNDNVPTTTNKGAGFVFNIGAGGGTFQVDSGRIFTVDDGTTGITGTGTTTGSVAQELQGTGNLTKTGTGTLQLRFQYNYSGAIDITAGTLQATGVAGVLGNTTAQTTIRSGAAFDVNGQAITDTDTVTVFGTGLASNPKGVITNNSATVGSYAGPIVLGGDSQIGAAAAGALTLGSASGITGAFNLTTSNAAAGGTTIAFLNNGGTFTNNGPGTGTTTLTSVGPLVTNIFQTGASPLTITGAYPVATLASGYTITNSGTGLFTLNGGVGTGTGNLVLNANNTGGITLGTTTVNSVGSITNSGTGTGTVTISAVIGANVVSGGASIIQNSPTSPLTLSGANLYTGTTTVNQGVLNVGAVNSLGSASSPVVLGTATTKGTLVYTGAAGTIARSFTINAGGGEIDSTAAAVAFVPASGSVIVANGPVTFGGSNNVTIGSTTYGTTLITGATSITKVGTGTTALSVALGIPAITNAATPINIQAGTFQLIETGTAGPSSGILGTGTITITPGATFATSAGGGTSVLTLQNPIAIAPGSGIANINGFTGALTDNQTITFLPGTTAATILRLNNTNTQSGASNYGGAVSGTGSIQLNSTGASGSPITLSGAQNQTGSITNVGTASGNNSVSTLSGVIGSGITAISQAGTNPFTVSSAIPLSTTLNTFTSTGTGTFTLSGSFGTVAQNLTLSANGNGAITLSNAALNIAGNIINSGTGGGVTTISSAIGTNVTGVIQNGSAPLLLTGTNTYTAPTTITLGTLEFQTKASLPGYATNPATAFSRVSVGSGGTLGLGYGTQFVEADVTNLLNGTYPVSWASSGASLGLDTTAGSATYAPVFGDAVGTTAFGLTKLGTNSLTVNSANTYTGQTVIQNGTLIATSLNRVVGGTASSSLGAPKTAATGAIGLGYGSTTGTLLYTGAGETTDRAIALTGGTGGGVIDQSGSGPLVFTSDVLFQGTGNKTLTLTGSTGAEGTISGAIAGGVLNAASGALTITKAGTGTWHLTGNGNTAQNIVISGGTLDLGPNGIFLNAGGGNLIQATGNGTVIGKIVLGGVATTNNGPDIGAAAGFTLDLTNAQLVDPTTPTQTYVDFYGGTNSGTLLLGNANTYTAISDISSGIIVVGTINSVANNATTGAVHSTASSLGAPLTVAAGTLNLTTSSNATLRYVGTGEVTDRNLVFTSGTAGGVTALDQSGSGPLVFLGNLTASGGAVHGLVLTGSTSSPAEFAGNIGENSTTNNTTLTKTGTGTWTLSGANTFTGATTVNAGNLVLSQGSAGTGKLSNTAITINAGGTLSPIGAYVVGNTATTARGGSLTLNAGGLLNLADGVINNFSLVQNSTFAGNALTLNGGAISFDLSSTASDSIIVSLGGTAGTGSATTTGSTGIAINPISNTLTPGNYTLIQAAGTLSNAGFYLASPNLNIGGTLYTLSLSLVGTNEVLTVSTGGTAIAPNTAYWLGNIDGSWASQVGGAGGATNFVAAATGAPNTFALPDAVTNVFFAANNANTPVFTTLDRSFTINSLNFTGAGTGNAAGATIARGTAGSLTINALGQNGNITGNGITVAAGAGPDTISADVILGSSQKWTNNSTSTLTISGVLGDGGNGFNLTTAGTGPIALTNLANTYGGITTIGTGGTLMVAALANGGLPSSVGRSSSDAGNLVFAGSGTLDFVGGSFVSDRALTVPSGATATFQVDLSGVNASLAGLTGPATTAIVTKTGPGTLTLTGAQTYTGNTNAQVGNLVIAGSLTGVSTASTGSLLNFGGAGGGIVTVSGNISSYLGFQGPSGAGTSGAYYQTGGAVTFTNTGTGDTVNAITHQGGSYGYMSLTGGSLTTNGRFDIAASGGTGVAYVGNGATLNTDNGEWFIIGPYTVATGVGSLTVGPGGTVLHGNGSAAVGLNMNINGSVGIFNMAGGLFTYGAKGLTFGNGTSSNITNTSGYLNLAGGTLTAGAGFTNANSGSGSSGASYINFAGGTIASTVTISNLIPSTTATQSFTTTVYGPVNNQAALSDTTQDFVGGANFDVASGTTTTVSAVLNGASGYGIRQADMVIVNGGAGYIGAPAVQFSKPAGGGVPASGYAVISGGQVTGIVITAPGTYAQGESPVLTLSGGGASTPASVSLNPLSEANANVGGVTKLNSGTLTLTGQNTYGGPTTIKGGTLIAGNLANGGLASAIGNSSNAASNLVLDGGALQYSGTAVAATDRGFTLTANGGTLIASGTTAGTLTISGNMEASATTGAQTLTLSGTGTGTAGSGTLSGVLANGGGSNVTNILKTGTGTWNLTNAASTYTGTTTISGGILGVTVLANGGVASSLGASSNAAANLVLSGGTLQYTGTGATSDRNYTFGNATTAVGGGFDSAGTGPLVLNGTMTPVNVTAGSQVLTLTANTASGANALTAGITDSSATALTGLTKAGAGAWTLGGASAYSGATTLNAGTLNLTGTNSLATPITLASGANATLNVNSSGTFLAGAINYAGASAGTINLLNGTLVTNSITSASSTSTGLVFNGGTLKSTGGAMTISGSLPIAVLAGGGTIDTSGGNITSASGIGNTASPGTLTVTGGNTLQSAFNSTFTGNLNITGNTTVRFVTTAAAYGGVWNIQTGSTLDLNNVGNYSFGGLAGGGTIVNTGASVARVITITGAGGNTFSGSINPTGTTSFTGLTVNLNAGGVQTFTGTHTYTGPTLVTGGTLAVTAGSLSDTAVTVSNVGTLKAIGNYTIGSGAAALTISAGGTVSLLDGALNTLTLNTAASGTGFSLTNGNLNFELSSAGTDKLVVNGGSTNVFTNGTVNISALGSTLAPGTYDLIAASGITAGNTAFKFSNGANSQSLVLGGSTYTLTLGSVDGIEQITVSAGMTALTWTGLTNGNGAANSLWSASPGGIKNFANNTTAADYAEGAPVVFQDTNTVTNANVTNGVVNIDAAGVNPGSVTVNNTAVNYTFQNAAAGTVGLAGATGLTKTGTGTLTLLGLNTYTGPTALNGGVVNLGVGEDGTAGPLGLGGPISFGGGTLQYSAANQTDYSARFSTATNQAIIVDTNGQDVTFATALTSGGGSLTKNGAGTLTLTTGVGTDTYTGATVINGGTLKLTGSGGSGGILSGTPSITVNAAGTLMIAGAAGSGDQINYTSGKSPITINGGQVLENTPGGRLTIGSTLTMVGGTLGGTSTGQNGGAYSFNVSGGSAINATSDAAGNPAIINPAGGIAIQNNSGQTFTVTRGAATPASDLNVNTPITNYTGGNGGITKAGNGIMTLNAVSTYVGGTTITGGTLITGVNNALPGTGIVNLGGNTTGTGVLDLNGTNQTIGGLSVTFYNTAPSVLNIAAGKTLTVNGNVSLGTTNATGKTAQSVINFTGTGSLVVNSNNGTFYVANDTAGTDNSALATVNMSTLSSFTANLGSGGTFSVQQAGDNRGGTAISSLTLSDTANTITAGTLNVGASATGASGNAQSLFLGAGTNVLNANSVGLGIGNRDSGLIQFAGANGTVVLRNAAGTGRANVTLGPTATQTTATTTNSRLDTTGHNADLAIGTLATSLGAKTANGVYGVLFDQGTLDVKSLNLAAVKGSGTSVTTVTINGGTVNLGGSAAYGDAGTGTLSLATAATGELRITGGTVTSTADLTKTTGSGVAILTLDGGSLDMGGKNIGGTVLIDTLNLRSGTLGNVAQINNGAGLTKTATTGAGANVLNLTGTNTYTGPTSVNSGRLVVSGSISGTTALNVSNGATLVLATAGNVNPGNATVNLGGGTGATSGGTLQIADGIGTSTSAMTETFSTLAVSFNSTIDFGIGTGVKLSFSGLAPHVAGTGADLAIVNWSGLITNNPTAGSDSMDRLIFNGNVSDFTSQYSQLDVSFNGVSGYQTVDLGGGAYEVMAVPEPSTLSTILLVVGLGAFRPRRRSRAAVERRRAIA